jgi:hypothetical protein
MEPNLLQVLLVFCELAQFRATKGWNGTMVAYQEQNGDYRVKAERSESVPEYFYYHFWQYVEGAWQDMGQVPEVVMVENLRGHSHLHAAEGYDYWRSS